MKTLEDLCKQLGGDYGKLVYFVYDVGELTGYTKEAAEMITRLDEIDSREEWEDENIQVDDMR